MKKNRGTQMPQENIVEFDNSSVRREKITWIAGVINDSNRTIENFRPAGEWLNWSS